jgi:hypothetical protein
MAVKLSRERLTGGRIMRQQVLQALLDQAVERRLAWTPRLVGPTADLHTSGPTGGRASGIFRGGDLDEDPGHGFPSFPEENHWVLKPQNSIQWHDTVLGWLDRWTQAR